MFIWILACYWPTWRTLFVFTFLMLLCWFSCLYFQTHSLPWALSPPSSWPYLVLAVVSRSYKLVFVYCIHAEGSWWLYWGDEVLPHRCVQNLCRFWWWHNQRAEFWGLPKSDIVSNPRLWPWPPWSLVRTVLVWIVQQCWEIKTIFISISYLCLVFHIAVRTTALKHAA